MTTRLAGVALLAVGIAVTVVGLGLRLFWTEDEGHHDGRTPTFARDAALGADELVVRVDGTTLSAHVERAGQVITDFDDVHDAGAHLYVASTELDYADHVDLAESATDGTISVDVPGAGDYRVVIQSAPSGGPDLLELGTTVTVTEGTRLADSSIARDGLWLGDGLAISQSGFDFVLSEDFDGDDYHGGPALLTMFHADDMAFTHAHAEVVDPDRLRFVVDLPARGEYLAMLQFLRGDELVTARFRFEV